MKTKYLLPAVIASLLVGCGTVSQVSQQGTTDNPVFPHVDKVTQDAGLGSWPNLDNLRQIHDGSTRDQLYHLIGRPHFAEGFGTREWDYLFHFRTDQGIKTCQFKVLFDTKKIARSFHWAPESCANILDPKPQEPVAFLLDGDVTFAFDSAKLTANGHQAVSNIAHNIKQQALLEKVVVAGHTDRLGSVAYNNNLSLERAESVRHALIAEGISARIIETTGYGKSQPVVQCDYTEKAQLTHCLAPNRRVEITATGATSE